MSHIEHADTKENTVVEEYRKGYKLKDKVLRPALVAVSKKPAGHGHGHKNKKGTEAKDDDAKDTNNITEEES